MSPSTCTCNMLLVVEWRTLDNGSFQLKMCFRSVNSVFLLHGTHGDGLPNNIMMVDPISPYSDLMHDR